MFKGFSIQTNGYKSFTKEINISDVSSINLFIGKNNSGKSNVIDIINYTFKEVLGSDRHSEKHPIIKIEFRNTLEELNNTEASESYYKLDEQHYNDSKFDTFLISSDFGKSIDWSNSMESSMIYGDFREEMEFEATERKREILSDCCCIHIQAERTIIPEERISISSNSELLKSIRPNGDGLTNLLRSILISKTDSKHYKQILIEGMNGILEPEISIKDLVTLSVDDGERFEIYVEEEGKPLYPLSNLGSGIKTTMHLIMMMELIPELINKDRGSIVFTLEELENNMHPSAQRRMYRYIQEYARENDSLFFISSHSNVSLNYFFGKEDASVYHVIQNDGISEISLISGQRESREIMDDIGANPSDLLQSNGIIWVEGPSDRIYIKRWLELAGFGRFVEGYHYQFMYYGGRLLSHYSTEDTDSLINMLRTNRHSALVMDSDKKKINSPINDTKKRIRKEFDDNGLYTWCTEGKEIENYLLAKDIEDAYPNLNNYVIGQFQPFSEFDGIHDKVSFAKKVTGCMDEYSLLTLDLEEQISRLGNEIARWNEDVN